MLVCNICCGKLKRSSGNLKETKRCQLSEKRSKVIDQESVWTAKERSRSIPDWRRVKASLHSWLLVIHRSWPASFFYYRFMYLVFKRWENKLSITVSLSPSCLKIWSLMIFFHCHEEWYKETTNIWFYFLNKSKLSCNFFCNSLYIVFI